jgi:hypothetical protein
VSDVTISRYVAKAYHEIHESKLHVGFVCLSEFPHLSQDYFLDIGLGVIAHDDSGAQLKHPSIGRTDQAFHRVRELSSVIPEILELLV